MNLHYEAWITDVIAISAVVVMELNFVIKLIEVNIWVDLKILFCSRGMSQILMIPEIMIRPTISCSFDLLSN